MNEILPARLLEPGLGGVAAWYVVSLSTYHLFTGAISYFAPSFALRFYRGAYGCDPIERRHLMIILRPWGALAFFAGTVGPAAVWIPMARDWIEVALLALLLMRISYRFNLRTELREISRISTRDNLVSIMLLIGGAALLGADLLRGSWRLS
jgi:hypothetical protein